MAAGMYLQVGKNNIWSEACVAAAAACSPFRLVAADLQSADWTLQQLSDALRGQGAGKAEDGAQIFREALCIQCHRVNGDGGALGPDPNRHGRPRSRSGSAPP